MATVVQTLKDSKIGKKVAVATAGITALAALTGCDVAKKPSIDERVTSLEQKADRTSADVTALTKSVGTLATSQKNLEGLVFAVSTNVTAMRNDMTSMHTDMGTMKQGLEDLKAALNSELGNIRNEIAASEARTLGVVTNYVGGGTAVTMNSSGRAVVMGGAIAQAPVPVVIVPASSLPAAPSIQLLSPGNAVPGTALTLGEGQYATPMPNGGHLVIDLRDPGMRGFLRTRQVFFVTSKGSVCDVDGYHAMGLPFVKLSPKTAYYRAHTRLAAYAQNRKVQAFCAAYERNGR